MKDIVKTLFLCFMLFIFDFSCVSVPKTASTNQELDIEVKIKELKDKIAKYELEIYDIENFNIAETEYNKSHDIISNNENTKIDKNTKAEIDAGLNKAYEHYKLTVDNGMPLYAKAQRASAMRERDKANSILAHRTVNSDYENAAVVFLKGEDEMLAENYETAGIDYVSARVGYEKSYEIARGYYERSSNSVKELNKLLKEIENIQIEIDGYQVTK